MISKHTTAEMLDSFFTRGFNASKCKTLLKLTIPRVKLLRNRREVQIKQMRRDIARLLETGQEASARIRVEHILREEKMMAAQEIVELFCELIAVRVPIIEAQKECPLDLKEAISSVCFAAPRCADLPELQEVQILFAGKYGKEFVHSATELKPECGVNRQLVELLSIRAPTPVVKVKLLEDIAKEHNLDWEPSGSELVKTNEDLLNGSEKPLPEVHRDEAKSTASAPASDEHTDSDEEFVMVDFHEVPRQQLQSYNGAKSAPEMLPFPADALSEDDEEEPNLNPKTKEIAEDEQFVPFLYPPSSTKTKTVNDETDLHDVLAAAQAAAESAEHAAAAAKTAASLAQLRITEVEKKEEFDFSSSDAENPFYFDKIKSEPEEEEEEEAEVDEENPFAQFNSSSPPEDYMANQRMVDHSYDDGSFDSYLESNYAFLSEGGVNQTQRLPSMDEDVYFSYPNLFASQGSK